MKIQKVTIGRSNIGIGEPCFTIAEAGSNHDRKLEQAKRLIDVAVAARADAVKFQSSTAEKIAARTKEDLAQIDFSGARSLFELYRKVELPREWQSELSVYCRERGIVFLSTPFDEEAVDQLNELGVEAFKIASFELVHLPLLRYVARKSKPIILSTGMSNLGEIEDALQTIYAEGNEQVIVLHCAINYPARFENVNLAAMDTMRQAFQVPVGYSDHTAGWTVPVAAVARGANVIEKHFTTDRGLHGPDHAFALAPLELGQMVRAIRETEAALGSPVKHRTATEETHYRRGRRSLFAKVDIPAGTVIRAEMLAVLRPGTDLHPKYLEMVVGRAARRTIQADEPITWELI